MTSVTTTPSGSSSKRKQFTLNDAVTFFSDERSNPKVKGNTKLAEALNTVEEIAKDRGLKPEYITTLLNAAASGRFAAATSQKLVKSLIPTDYVPSEAVLSSISWLCTNIPSITIQSLLLRWIILIFDCIEDRKGLHAMYGILFYFLENETLCPHVCHLLYLLTSKDDVKLFRVQRVLSLQQKMGSQPYIMGLLSIYKLFCPNLVAIVIPRARTVCFRQTDYAWSRAIQKVREQQKENRTYTESDEFLQRKNVSPAAGPRVKRSRQDLVPEIATAKTNETRLDDLALVPFEQIKDFEDCLKNIHRIELPCQIGSALDSHILKHVVSVLGDKYIDMRLGYWLHSVLHEEFLVSPDEKTVERRENFLRRLLNFVDFLQEGVPVCEMFLIHFLQTWNGRDFQSQIFKLITKLKLHPFEVLNDLVFEPLRKLYFCSSVIFKCQVIVCFTELLQNLTLFELPRYRACIEHQKAQLLKGSSESTKNFHCAFYTDVWEFSPNATLAEVIEFIDDLCTTGLQQENDNTLLLNYVLDFFTVVSNLCLQYDVGFVKIPSSAVIYHVLFSRDALAVSKLGHIMCNYRNAFSKLKNSMSDLGRSEDLGITQIPKLNMYIKDLCNALWQKKAFPLTEGQSVFDRELVKDIERPHLNAAFSATNHQAFLPFCYNYLEEKESDPANRKPHSITKVNRAAYLDALGKENLTGLQEFISSHIRPSSVPSTKDTSSVHQ